MNALGHPDFKLFHTGMIVPDLDLAMGTMSEALGIGFVDPITTTGRIRNPVRSGQRRTRLTFSVTGPHRVELLEHVDAELWKYSKEPVHHLGFAVSDLQAGRRHLEASRYVTTFELFGPDNHTTLAYYLRSPVGGLWIEILDEQVHDDLMAWVESGSAPKVAEAR